MNKYTIFEIYFMWHRVKYIILHVLCTATAVRSTMYEQIGLQAFPNDFVLYTNHNMYNVKIQKNNRPRRKDLLMRDRFNTDHFDTYMYVHTLQLYRKLLHLAHKATSLIPSLFIQVPVSSQERICVRSIDLHFSTIFGIGF